ncbi:MAG: GNAT family N-acetyltransferase [Anaerolineales bacterium]
MSFTIHFLESPAEMYAVEELQRQVWGMDDFVPHHLLLTVAHNGGVLIGAFVEERMVGFVFGFPGLINTSDRPIVKHCSHMLGVHPEFEGRGIGFALKRAQWQMVRRQGIERITWTYDPLLSRNAYLNISRLGAVSNTYVRNMYGEMRGSLNRGLPSDRLQVDQWVNSPRVNNRMRKRPRRKLDLAHYLSAGAEIINPTRLGEGGWPRPPDSPWIASALAESLGESLPEHIPQPTIHLLEIPSDFQSIKAADPELAITWRLHTRALLEEMFGRGYLITGFVYLRGENPRSFYVLSDGEMTLGA